MMSDMDFIFAGNDKFDILWEQFIQQNSASWRYLPEWRTYQKSYCRSTLSQDSSFIICNSGIPVVICPLFIEQIDNVRQFSYAGDYLMGPLFNHKLSKNIKNKVEKICFQQIDELAQQHHVAKSMIGLDQTANYYEYNILMKYGYLDASIQTCIIDLTPSLENIRTNVRKRVKSYINKVEKNFELTIIDSSNCNRTLHRLYQQCHQKCAGRITRAAQTFDEQYNMLLKGNAILIALHSDDIYFAFSYFFNHVDHAFYASASKDPDFETDIPLEHFIIWSAIKYYKQRGYRKFEMGAQQFSVQCFDFPTAKDINISFFKKAFGGENYSYYRGIKYYNRDVLKKDLEANFTNVMNNYKFL